MRRKFLLLVLLLTLPLGLVSCGFIEEKINTVKGKLGQQQPAPIVQTPPPVKQGPTAPSKTPETIDNAGQLLAQKRQLDHLLATEKYLEALEIFRQELNQEQGGEGFAKEYRDALNGAITKGNSFLSEKAYEQAGIYYRAALDNYPSNNSPTAEIILSSSELTAQVDFCSERLMEKGLQTYRGGQLQEAIDKWQTILVFNPKHKASRNAIQTANTQLSNLEKFNQQE